MREIRFRAWDGEKMHKTAGIGPSGTILVPYTNGERHTSDKALIGSRATIMQYTGMLDESGKEVYEGDIVQCPQRQLPFYKHVAGTPLYAVIEWKQGVYAMRIPGQPTSRTLEGGCPWDVTGNVHEHPHLLANE